MQALNRFIVAVAALLITALLVACIILSINSNKKGYEAVTTQKESLEVKETDPDRAIRDENGNPITDAGGNPIDPYE